MDAEEETSVIESRRYAGAVEADRNAVEALEIVAAPTCILGDKKLVGAQSYENLVKFVVAHGARDAAPVLRFVQR